MPTTSRSVRRAVLALAATLVLAVGAFIAADALGRDTGSGSPAGTVRDFLIAAVAERNGNDACAYLTSNAVGKVAAIEPRGTECRAALATAQLTLGGHSITDEATIKGLAYHVRQSAGRASVTVSADGGAHTFTLRQATPNERAEFDPPDTSWRIDTGVDPLLTGRR